MSKGIYALALISFLLGLAILAHACGCCALACWIDIWWVLVYSRSSALHSSQSFASLLQRCWILSCIMWFVIVFHVDRWFTHPNSRARYLASWEGSSSFCIVACSTCSNFAWLHYIWLCLHCICVVCYMPGSIAWYYWKPVWCRGAQHQRQLEMVRF